MTPLDCSIEPTADFHPALEDSPKADFSGPSRQLSTNYIILLIVDFSGVRFYKGFLPVRQAELFDKMSIAQNLENPLLPRPASRSRKNTEMAAPYLNNDTSSRVDVLQL
jgi:hypothetical protein